MSIKISELPLGSALSGTEELPIVQSATTKKITTQDIADLASSSGAVWGGITGDITDQTDLVTALNLKVDAVPGKGLSANDFTNTLKTKLDGIEAGAEVNVNADWNAISGDAQILNKPTIPSVAGLVPYTGATADVNLGTFHLDAAKGTFTHNGSTDTLTANHTSGSGIGLLITKGGANEGLKVNKTSGSGNAATIIGTLEATTLVKTGGTSSQYLMADGSTNTLNQAIILSLLGWFKTLVTANTTITGTTGETIVSSTQVPTLSNGTIFKINTLRFTKGALAGSTIRAYLSPNSANLSGAVQILSTGSVIVAGTRLATISRVFEIEGGNIKGLSASTGVLNDNGTSTVVALDAALPAGTLYLIVTVTNSLTTESTTQELLDISNF
jgi:hypothetical protein